MGLAGSLIPRPFRFSGLGIPVHLAVVAKIFALVFCMRLAYRGFNEPFLPFVPILDAIPWPWLWHRGLQVLALGSAVSILLGVRVRLSCMVFGAATLLAILSSRIAYSNNMLFAAVMLALIGLVGPGRRDWLLRAQMTLAYGGAALNKLLDVDWRTGQFFQNWSEVLEMTWFLELSEMFPPLALAQIASWGAIVVESALAALWLLGARRSQLAWFGLSFHLTLSLYSGGTYGMFLFLSAAAYLILFPWPGEGIEARFNPGSALSRSFAGVQSVLDRDRIVRWAGDAPVSGGISVTLRGARYEGYAACRRVVLHTPILHVVMAGVLLLLTPSGRFGPAAAVTAIGAMVLLSPAAELLASRNR